MLWLNNNSVDISCCVLLLQIPVLVRSNELLSAFVLNFNNIFSNKHLKRTGQSMNSPPSQILERCAQPKI